MSNELKLCQWLNQVAVAWLHETLAESIKQASPTTVWQNLFASLRKLYMLQINHRSGSRHRATDEDTLAMILAAIMQNPRKSTQRLFEESSVSRLSIRFILKANKWPSYKLHMAQHLSEDDLDRHMEFCKSALTNTIKDGNFSTTILFTDEAIFNVNGEVISKIYVVGVMRTLNEFDKDTRCW